MSGGEDASPLKRSRTDPFTLTLQAGLPGETERKREPGKGTRMRRWEMAKGARD